MQCTAEHIRDRCAGLLEALAALLDAAALRAELSKTDFLLQEIPGAALWYQHQKGRTRISPAKYLQYRSILCATDAERAALNEHWLAYQRSRQQIHRPHDVGSLPADPHRATGDSVTSSTIDRAIELARETTTLRLRQPQHHRPPPSGIIERLRFPSDEPRHLINTLAELGIACNGQAAEAVPFFLAHQDRFRQAGAALIQLGPSALEETVLAQSVSCLLRFSRQRMNSSDQDYWSSFCTRLDHRLGSSAEWLYRLRSEFPGYSATNAQVWQFQHQRARHFLNALQARAAHPNLPPHQIDGFLRLGSCVLSAYSYLLQTQLAALRSNPAQQRDQIERGETTAAAIRRLADDDSTRHLLGTAATDSERVPTALSTVYRSMANLHLMVARSAGHRERQAALRSARTNILMAHELLLADRPPWLHGIANNFVTAAAFRFFERKLPAAEAYLMRAVDGYRRTADWYRATTCEIAVAQVRTSPDLIDWTQLIFVE